MFLHYTLFFTWISTTSMILVRVMFELTVVHNISIHTEKNMASINLKTFWGLFATEVLRTIELENSVLKWKTCIFSSILVLTPILLFQTPAVNFKGSVYL